MTVAVRVDGVFLLTGLAAVGGVVLWLNRQKLADAAGAVVEAVNPNDPNNIAYTAVNDAGAAITGDPEFNLGGAAYDTLNPYQSEMLAVDELGLPTENAQNLMDWEKSYAAIHGEKPDYRTNLQKLMGWAFDD